MSQAPLAERMRPRTLDEVVGQQHLLGAGKPLRTAFESGEPHSMILWGPPGVGKTTLARLMADGFNAEFMALSAVLSGVKDIRDAVERATLIRSNSGRRTILFVDEVHRFNKSQQDAFLPHVESGLFTFIGATTENPSFEVNNALLSRAAVYVLKALDDTDLKTLIARALEKELPGLSVSPEAQDMLVMSADGDARRLLNNLEIAAQAATAAGEQTIDVHRLRETLGDVMRRFDNKGDNFYDQISALHKSVRGSNPDAALYWLARMLDGGVDPRYLARRIIRMSWEDIGLADPRAIQIANDAATTYERLGSPEGELALALGRQLPAQPVEGRGAQAAAQQQRTIAALGEVEAVAETGEHVQLGANRQLRHDLGAAAHHLVDDGHGLVIPVAHRDGAAQEFLLQPDINELAGVGNGSGGTLQHHFQYIPGHHLVFRDGKQVFRQHTHPPF